MFRRRRTGTPWTATISHTFLIGSPALSLNQTDSASRQNASPEWRNRQMLIEPFARGIQHGNLITLKQGTVPEQASFRNDARERPMMLIIPADNESNKHRIT